MTTTSTKIATTTTIQARILTRAHNRTGDGARALVLVLTPLAVALLAHADAAAL